MEGVQIPFFFLIENASIACQGEETRAFGMHQMRDLGDENAEGTEHLRRVFRRSGKMDFS